MKKPGIIDGIIVAAIISIIAGAASLLFGGFIGHGDLFNLLLLGATLIYLLYLLKRSPTRVGRVVLMSAWACVSLVGWFFGLALLEQILIQAAFIWLTRALYFHNSLFSAALDFGLVAVGLAAGAWAMVNTGSQAAALWSFFLLQALFCWIPELARKQRDGDIKAAAGNASFQSAHRVAADAVRKLTQS